MGKNRKAIFVLLLRMTTFCYLEHAWNDEGQFYGPELGLRTLINWAICKKDKVRRLSSENRNREQQRIVGGLQNNYLIENLVQVPNSPWGHL